VWKTSKAGKEKISSHIPLTVFTALTLVDFSVEKILNEVLLSGGISKNYDRFAKLPL
jgi:hypothetical protein